MGEVIRWKDAFASHGDFIQESQCEHHVTRQTCEVETDTDNSMISEFIRSDAGKSPGTAFSR